MNTHPGANSGTEGLRLPKFPALCGSPGKQQKSLDRNFLFVGIIQRERRPLGGAEGKTRLLFLLQASKLRLPSYSSLPRLDRAGSSRLPQPTTLRVREQAEDRNVHVGRGDRGHRGILRNRTGVFLGRAKEEVWVAVR